MIVPPDPTGSRGGRRPRPRRAMAAALVLMAAVAAGCGDAEGTGTAPDTGGPATSSPTGTMTASPTDVAVETVTVTALTTVTATASTTVTVTEGRGTGTTIGARAEVADLERELAGRIEQQYPVVGPGEVRCEAEGTLGDWQPVLCHFVPDDPAEFAGIHVSMLDGGRYAWALAECCGAAPWPDDYPGGLFCRDLREPPPGWNGLPDSDHLTYGLAVYYWLSEGRPDRMDADRDGTPCETVYPAQEVAAFWESVRVLDGSP
jgi:hypothetical protein